MPNVNKNSQRVRKTHKFDDFGDSRRRSDVAPVDAAAAPEAAAAAGDALVGTGQIDSYHSTRHFRHVFLLARHTHTPHALRVIMCGRGRRRGGPPRERLTSV
jgi:hypothetical protein